MKIGVISDTHDNIPLIERAIGLFKDRGVGYLLHAGDFIAPFSIKPYNNLQCPFIGVFGNNDGEKNGLVTVSNGRIHHPPKEIELSNRKICLVHEKKEVPSGDTWDIVISGHTHEPKIEKNGKTLWLNPGEGGGWLKGRATVAIVDLDNMAVEIVELSNQCPNEFQDGH